MAETVVRDSLASIHATVTSDILDVLRAAKDGESVKTALATGDHPDWETKLANSARRLAGILLARAIFKRQTGQSPPEGVPPPFDRLPPNCIPYAIALEAIADIPQERFDPRWLDDLYELSVSRDAKTTRGQFFTPPSITNALVTWAVGDGRHRVLDPAVGTGRFLIPAARALNTDNAGRLVGVDVDPIALDYARLKLMAETPQPRFALRETSFFGLDPNEFEDFDAVIGNPPYLRAETLDGTIRRHLASFGDDETTPYLDGEKRLSKRCDAYVYFVTFATQFLRPGGRLAMILPSKWLASAYGEGFQRFLFEQYNVEAVIGFETHVFDDALIDTCLLLAERTPPTGETRFLRLHHPSQLQEGDASLLLNQSLQDHGIGRRQTRLQPGNLEQYLRTPRELHGILNADVMVPLSDLADVSRGVMTGANRFFFLDGPETTRWDIDEQFLQPAVKSMRTIKNPVFQPADVQQYMVDVHHYITRLEASTPEEVIGHFERDGHEGIVHYVSHAEANEWHSGRTCQSRRVWFDLGELPVPDAFVPKLLRERVFVIENRAQAVPSNAIDCLNVADEVDATALLGVLNSTVGQVAMEIQGRNEAGMLQLMTYETASLPVPDVRALSPGAVRELRSVTRAALGDGKWDGLDATVLRVFGFDISVDRLRALRDRMVRTRLTEKAKAHAQ